VSGRVRTGYLLSTGFSLGRGEKTVQIERKYQRKQVYYLKHPLITVQRQNRKSMTLE